MSLEQKIQALYQAILKDKKSFLSTIYAALFNLYENPQVTPKLYGNFLDIDDINVMFNLKEIIIFSGGHKYTFQLIKAFKYLGESPQAYFFLVLPIQLGKGVNGAVKLAIKIEWQEIINADDPVRLIQLDFQNIYKYKQVTYPPDPSVMKHASCFQPNYAVMNFLNPNKVYLSRFDRADLPMFGEPIHSQDDVTDIIFLPLRSGLPMNVWLENKPHIDINGYIKIFLQMVYRILRLHLEGVTIRDVKLDNFVIDRDCICLIDEDSMRNTGTDALADTAALTSCYAAPEHAYVNVPKPSTPRSPKVEVECTAYEAPGKISHPSQDEMLIWTKLREVKDEHLKSHDAANADQLSQ